jgi:hypothetical protein
MNMGVFNTHKFFYTLNHEGTIKGKKVIFLDRNNTEKSVIVDRIEIGTSPISFRLYDTEGNRHTILFIKIREVFNEKNELVWDSKDIDLSNVRTIKVDKVKVQKKDVI